MTLTHTIAAGWLMVLTLCATAAPIVTPHRPEEQFRAYTLSPPAMALWLRSTPETRSDSGPSTLVDEPRFPLGTDYLGRDVFTRLVFGARLSMGLAVVAALCATVIGVIAGALSALFARSVGRAIDAAGAFTTATPLLYVVIFLRAILPLTLEVSTVALALVGVFAAAAWPPVAAGVRAVMTSELSRDYVAALRACGAGPVRLLWRLLPATASFVCAHFLLLVPSFMIAESTLSFVGWGFPPESPSWGTMLQDGVNLAALVDYPWLLSAGAAIASVSLALQLLRPAQTSDRS